MVCGCVLLRGVVVLFALLCVVVLCSSVGCVVRCVELVCVSGLPCCYDWFVVLLVVCVVCVVCGLSFM